MFIYHLISYFFIYAYLGWLLEVIYQGAVKKVLTNRGFLNGPICPIYGVGINVAIILFTPFADNILLLYLLGVLMTSGLELVVGYALDKLFHMRWWDYSKEPYNIRGYICLKFCFLWGVGVLVAMKIAHPIVSVIVDKIPLPLGIVFNLICTILIIVDLIVTYKEVIGITRSLGEIETLAAKLKEVSDNMSETVGATAITTSDMMSEGKDRVAEAVVNSKDKVAEAVVNSKDKVAEAVVNSKDKVAEVVVNGKDKVAEAVVNGKDKVAEAVVNGKDKVAEVVVNGKDKVTEVVANSKDKVAEVVVNSKEKMSEAMANGKELMVGAVSGNKEKVAGASSDRRQKSEIEERYEKLLAQLKKQSARMSSAFPQWRVTGNASSMEEYINNLSEKYQRRYEVYQAFKKEEADKEMLNTDEVSFEAGIINDDKNDIENKK